MGCFDEAEEDRYDFLCKAAYFFILMIFIVNVVPIS